MVKINQCNKSSLSPKVSCTCLSWGWPAIPQMQSHLCSRGFFLWNPLSSPFCCYNSTLPPQWPPAESFPQPSCNESLSLVFSWHLKKILKTFIFGCAGSLLLSLIAARGGSSGQASHCGGFSLQSAGSTGVGFSNSGSWAQELWPAGPVALRHVGSSRARDWTCVTHWQVDSLPLSHQGSPSHSLLSVMLPFTSVQFSRSVVSNSLWPHGLQHVRPPCPSPTPGVYPNSCPLSWWCHPTISSSVIPFSSCPQSSWHWDLFKWVNSSHEVAKVLEFQLQHQSFQWTLRTDLL